MESRLSVATRISLAPRPSVDNARESSCTEDAPIIGDEPKFNIWEDDWPKYRIWTAKLVTNRVTEIILIIFVLFSISLSIIEADRTALGDEVPSWIDPIEQALLIFYCIEMAARLYALRKKFFEVPIHVLELCIVIIDTAFAFLRLVQINLPNISFLRVLRLMKLARAFRILATQPQLKFFVEAFAASLKTMLFGSLFILVALVVFGILSVEFLYPLKPTFSATCTRCPEAFMTVYESMCAVFQAMIMQDEWAELFRPFLAEYPETCFLIIPMFMIIHLGLMNLIMAGIVDSANQAHEASFRIKAEKIEAEYAQLQEKFHGICKEMDRDGSGTVTCEELLKGYARDTNFRTTLNAMDIKERDLEAVFEILDQDGSGDVGYDEFVKELHKLKSSDAHTMLVFIKHYVTQMQKVQKSIQRELLQTTDGIEKLSRDMDTLRSTVQSTEKTFENHLDAALQQEIKPLLQQEELRQEGIASHQQVANGLTEKPKPLTISAPVAGSFAKPDDVTSLQNLGILSLPPVPLPATATTASADAGTAAQDITTYSHLQAASEQIGTELEELKFKCERSVVLLTGFRCLLPHTTKSAQLSPRGAAHTGSVSHSFHQEAQQGSLGFWNSQSCCKPALRSSSRGLPHPESSFPVAPVRASAIR